MLDWWDFQKGWRVQMQLFFSELIFPSGFLPWGAVTLRLIGRIACMMEGGAPIGRALSSSVYWDGMTDQISWKVLGRRIRWSAHRTMSHCCFFPDFSPATAIRRKAFGPVLKKMTALGLQPFLIYPAVIKLRHKGEQRSFDSPQKAEDFISSMSQQKSYAAALRGDDGGAAAAVSPVRREGRDGRDGLGPSCQKGMIAGWPWMLAKPIFCVFFSYTGILSLFIRYNDLFAGKTDTPFFCFGGD